MVIPQREWEVREFEVERYLATASRMQAIGFGSGGSVTAVVQKTPRAIYQFEYAHPEHPLAGPTAWANRLPSRSLPLTTATDVVGVTRDGIPLFLDEATASVQAYTIGGRRLVVAILDSAAIVRSACAIDNHTIAFVEASRPDTVFIRALDEIHPKSVAMSPIAGRPGDAAWASARLTGLMGAGCALWAPTWKAIVTIGDSGKVARWHLHWTAGRASIIKRVSAWFLNHPQVPVLTRDVTVFPGGVAVLPADGEAIDFYSFMDGRYLVTARLRRPSLRIAGAPDRIFVLSQSQDSVLLASYVLPSAARGLAPELSSQVPPEGHPPEWLRILRGKSQ